MPIPTEAMTLFHNDSVVILSHMVHDSPVMFNLV